MENINLHPYYPNLKIYQPAGRCDTRTDEARTTKFHGLRTDNTLTWKTCQVNQVKYNWSCPP